MEKLNKMKRFLKKKKKEVEKILEAPEQQRKIDRLEKENDRLRGKNSKKSRFFDVQFCSSKRIRFTFSLEHALVRRIVLRMFFRAGGNTRGEHSHLV